MKKRNEQYGNEEMLFALFDTGNGTIAHILPAVLFNGRELVAVDDGKVFDVSELEKYGIEKNTPVPGIFVVKPGRDLERIARLLIDDGFRSTTAFTEFINEYFAEKTETLQRLVATVHAGYVSDSDDEEHECSECGGKCGQKTYHVLLFDNGESKDPVVIRPTVLVSASNQDEAIDKANEAIQHIAMERDIQGKKLRIMCIAIDDETIYIK